MRLITTFERLKALMKTYYTYHPQGIGFADINFDNLNQIEQSLNEDLWDLYQEHLIVLADQIDLYKPVLDLVKVPMYDELYVENPLRLAALLFVSPIVSYVLNDKTIPKEDQGLAIVADMSTALIIHDEDFVPYALTKNIEFLIELFQKAL